MPKLRDMTVNIIPKLDVRKAKEMSGQLDNIMSKNLGMLKKADSFVQNMSTVIGQGLQLVDKLSDTFDKPRKLIGEAMESANVFIDIAEKLGTIPQKILPIVAILEQSGVGMASALELMDKFANNAPNLGFSENLDDVFVDYIKKLANVKGKELQKLIEDGFGKNHTIDFKNIITAAKNWDKFSTTAKPTDAYADAIDQAAMKQDQIKNIKLDGGVNRLLMANKDGYLDSQVNITAHEEKSKTNLLANTSPDAMQNISIIIDKITNMLDVKIQKLITTETDLANAMAVFNTLHSAIVELNLAIKGMSVSSDWGKNR